MALECGDTMIATLDNILTISKRINITECQHRPFNLVEVVNTTMIAVLNHEANSKGILSRVLCDVSRTDVLEGDATLVQQILSNLLSNAIKFSSEGDSVQTNVELFHTFDEAVSREETISKTYTRRHVATDSYDRAVKDGDILLFLFVSVEDNGCGMASGDVGCVFEAYTQISSGEQKAHQGTGLGLNICLLNAINMRGRLSAASSIGAGTCMGCILPMKKGSGDDELVQVQDTTAICLDKKAPSNPVFIVVDDSRVNMRLAKKQILAGIQPSVVHVASNGLEGYNLFVSIMHDGGRVHGIFMDYHMPVMCGCEAIKRIREYEKENSLGRVAITAFTADLTEASSAQLLASGATSIIYKPIAKGVIVETCICELNKMV